MSNYLKGSLPFFIALTLSLHLSGQRVIPPTDSLHVIGQVKMPIHYSISDLDQFPKSNLPDQLIYNQKGDIKDTLTQLFGVPLKSILEKAEFLVEKPKELNEFYFIFQALDGYKVVFSWNEIFNTTVGEQCYIITSAEGKTKTDIQDHILFISTGDLKTGRRIVRGLDRIEVKRVE
jgi:hypothetical protein